MTRQSVITRARALLQQRANRTNNKPTISTDEDGNLRVKIGTGGILIRLASVSRSDRVIESDSIEG